MEQEGVPAMRMAPRNPKSAVMGPGPGSRMDLDHSSVSSEEDASLSWFQHWGTCKRDKEILTNEALCNVGTHNINSFPDRNAPKMVRLLQTYKDMHVVGMSELNRNWFKMQEKDQLRERFKKLWRNKRLKTTWLKDRDWRYSRVQQGGVATMMRGQAATYVQDVGEDKHGLGRWNWMCLEATAVNTKTCIIQMYRPNKNTEDPGSVFMQQKSRMRTDECPLERFDKDLLDQIDELMMEGFQIILMGDFNTDLTTTSPLIEGLRERSIVDIMEETLGYDEVPNTRNPGSKPIDGIFASKSLVVARCGYDAGDTLTSDHRFLWAQFTWDSMLGIHRSKVCSPKERRLQTKYEKVLAKFNSLFEGMIEQHKLLEKAAQLDSETVQDQPLTDEQADRYEQLDHQLARCVAGCERQCRKLFPNDIAFSPAIKEAIAKVAICKEIVRKMHLKKKIRPRLIIAMKNRWKTQQYFEVPLNLDEAKSTLCKAWKEFQEAKEQAPELREHFINVLIEEAEEEGDEKKVKDLENSRDRERSKESHDRIRFARGKMRTDSSVKYIEKNTPNGRVPVHDKKETIEGIMESNAKKLHQCNDGNTPLRSEPLEALLTKDDYDTWESFLKGEIEIPDGLDDGVTQWLELFKGIEGDICDMDLTLTHEEMASGWGKIREKTSSLPHPIHFGVMKAMKDSEMAAKLHTIMMNIPMRTGYQPESWKNDVEAMLLKKPDNLTPEKLRRISLLHAYFNFNNKTIGRKAMKNGEKLGYLADEQAGSRKRLSAEKHALNKRLLLDIMRVAKRPGILCANDAKSCYDRILHFAIYVSMRRVGVPKSAISSMLGILRGMRHKIRTAYGDSEETYGGEEDDDQHGASQGNGAGPAIWALVSSPLLEILRKNGYGAKLLSPIKKEFFHLCGFAFVDDTDTVQVMEPGTSTEELIAIAQEELNLWEQLIKATGGALEGEKSDFTIVQWVWKDGKASYMAMQGDKYKMTVVNAEGDEEQLTQLAPDEARRTLGVWQASDGNEKVQVEKMKEKAVDWSNRIQCSCLDRPDLELAVKTTLYPSITFGQMATCLTKGQCDEVFTPVRKKIVPKMKVCRNTPGVLIHGPLKYGGLGFKHLHTTQGIAHVKALLDEGERNSPTGKLIRILAEYHTIEIGLPGEVFQNKYEEVRDFMTDSWVKNTLEFISENSIEIQSTVGQLRLWRDEDSYLAEDYLGCRRGKPTKAQSEAFARCRKFLRVVTRSDISEASGTHIRRGIWDLCNDGQGMSSNAYIWPHQERPSHEDITEWRYFLTSAYGIEEQRHKWRQPLGDFLTGGVTQCKWRLCEDDQRIYERANEDEGWNIWCQRPTRSRRKTYYRLGEQSATCPESAPVSVTQRGNEIAATSVGTNCGTAEACTMDTNEGGSSREIEDLSLAQILESVDPSLQWAIEDLELPADGGRSIAEAIRTDMGRCISDGSLKELFGTSAFKFMMGEKPTYVGKNRVPGTDRDQTSYRSELCGMLGNVIMVNAVCKAFGITEEFPMTMACDNISALWKSFDEEEPRQSDASSDILMAIRHQLELSPLKWKRKWVRGHQDDKHQKGDDEEIQPMDEWAIENIEVDRIAGAYWTKMIKERIPEELPFWDRMEIRHMLRPPSTRMPGETWQVHLGDEKLVGRVDDFLYDHCHRTEILEYWVQKGRFTEEGADLIDWDSHAKAMKAFGPRKHWVTKHFSGWAGSGENMQLWGFRESAECPRCEEPESTLHVLRCKSESANEEFWEATETFAEWLVKKTSTELGQALIDHALAAREDRDARIHQEWSNEVQQACLEQRRVGNRSMVEGLPTRHWRHIIQSRNTSGDSIEKGLRWTSALIRKNWEISWDMWVARNDLVHNDGEIRDTLVIKDLNYRIRHLQKEGSRCRNLFKDDRKFFKTPYWKIKKKTEQQKIRYIETATRLMDDSRNASQQTLDNWRELQEEYSSSDSEGDTVSSGGREIEEQQGHGIANARLQQSQLLDFNFTRTGVTTTASINGESSGLSSDGSDSGSQSSDEDDDVTRPSAVATQPSAGLPRPSAGRLRPSAGPPRPSAESNQPAAGPNRPTAGSGQPPAELVTMNPTSPTAEI